MSMARKGEGQSSEGKQKELLTGKSRRQENLLHGRDSKNVCSSQREEELRKAVGT